MLPDNENYYLPTIRGCQNTLEKPFPSGPFGERITIRRGTLSSIELINFIRESKRSGRDVELSDILTTLHADDLPFRCEIRETNTSKKKIISFFYVK